MTATTDTTQPVRSIHWPLVLRPGAVQYSLSASTQYPDMTAVFHTPYRRKIPSNTAYNKQPHPTTQQDRQHTAVFTHTLHYFRSDTAPCFHAAACPAARPGDPDCMSRPHETRSCMYTPFTATQPCTPPHSHDPACRIAPPTAPQSLDCASSQDPCVGQLCVTAAAPQQSS